VTTSRGDPPVAIPSREAAVLYRMIPYLGSSMAVLGGALLAQAPGGPQVPIGGGTTIPPGVAGVIVSFTGLAMHLGAFYFQWLDRKRADLALEAKNKALQARVEAQEAELAKVRSVAVQTNSVAATNTARVAGIQGGQEGLIETLQAKGVVDVPGGPHDRYGMRSTMLIVEDDAATARQLMRLFMKLGFYATHAATVDDALEQLAEPSKRTHWLVLDLNLGPGNGLEVLRYIRRLGLAPPRVAVLTGEDDPARLQDVEALKPDVLLLKPIAFKELVTKINPNLAPPEAGEVVH
jgi:CheY-like chemotaxis protein